MINREATLHWKGYDPEDLPKNSHKRVWAVCERCEKGRWVNYRDYRDLCYPCSAIANSGEGSYMYGRHHSDETKEKIREKRIGTHVSDEVKAKLSESRMGEKNHFYGKHHTDESKKKQSISKKGKPNLKLRGVPKSEEHKQNLSKAAVGTRGGELNGNWKGGITPERAIFYNSDGYSVWRIGVFIRDNFTCQECGVRSGNLNAHHILPYRDWKEPRFSLNIKNGITLCEDCHRETYGKEYEFWGQYFDIANGVGI